MASRSFDELAAGRRVAFARRQAEEHGRMARLHSAHGADRRRNRHVWAATELAYSEARVAAHFAGIVADEEDRLRSIAPSARIIP